MTEIRYKYCLGFVHIPYCKYKLALKSNNEYTLKMEAKHEIRLVLAY